MMTSPLGIDISKRKFDACLIRDAGKLRHRSFPNSADGFAQLSAWLTKYKAEQVHACLEATGAYGESLAAYLHESGSSVRRPARLSKTGAPRLRKALYFPAIVAMRHNPHVRALSERLKERGKCPMQIIGAAMRKLVHIAYGVLKSGKPFDPAMAKTA